MRYAVVLALVAACGRVAFDPIGEAGAGDDGAGDDGAPVAPGTTITLSSTGSCTRIAWSGSHIGVVWREGTNFGASKLWFAEADTSGTFTIPAFLVVDAVNNVECPAIAWTGTDYLIAFATGALNKRDIDTFRVSPTGAVTARVNVVSDAGDSIDPVLAINNNVAVLAWQDQTGTNYNTKARALTLAGAGAQPPVTLSGIDATNSAPALAATQSGFIVTWKGTTLRLRAFDAAGTLVTPETEMGVSAGGALVEAWTGTDLYGAWAGGDQVGTVRFDTTGAPTSSPTTFAADRARAPVIVWTGSEAAVLYLESYGAVQYHLARFTPTGDYAGETAVASATASFAPAALLFANGHFIASFEANLGAIVRVIAP